MVGWHHCHNGHGFGWTPGVGDGQGGLACCSSWGCKELDTTERLNCTELTVLHLRKFSLVIRATTLHSVNNVTWSCTVWQPCLAASGKMGLKRTIAIF